MVRGLNIFRERFEGFKQKSTGKPTLYRFSKPSDESFPYVLELFARRPELIEPPADCHLTPLPIAEGVSSPTVTIDLLVKALLALGATRKQVGRVVGTQAA